MRKFLLCMLIFIVVAGVAWAEEEEVEADKKTRASVSFILINSYAPICVGAELFLGKVGLGQHLQSFFLQLKVKRYFSSNQAHMADFTSATSRVRSSSLQG